MIRTLAAAFFAVILILVMYAFTSGSAIPVVGFSPGDPNPSTQTPFPWLDAMLGGVFMLIGILFGSVYESLKGVTGPVSIVGQFLGRSPHSTFHPRAGGCPNCILRCVPSSEDPT